MSRAARVLKLKFIIPVVVLIIAGAAADIWSHTSSPAAKSSTSVSHKLTRIVYNGQNNVDALTLLKKHATVQTKHYSFGDEVVSIDGSVGNGPKYWTFYVNGKESDVGASSYITKTGDKLEWKLQ